KPKKMQPLLPPQRRLCSTRKQSRAAINPTPTLRRRSRRAKRHRQSQPKQPRRRKRPTKRRNAYSGLFSPSAGLAAPAAGEFALVSLVFGSGANIPSGFGSSLLSSGFAAGFFFASDLAFSSPLVARLVARPGPDAPSIDLR